MTTVAGHGCGWLTLVRDDETRSGRFSMSEQYYLLGRADHCDIWIDDICVSREHAEIAVNEKNEVWLRSLSKTAETKVDDTMVKEILLEDGVTIGIGGHYFIYNSPGSAKKVKMRAAAL
jgi:pSer/pThr/pTyr-binding forkhead associated (FHA) protein